MMQNYRQQGHSRTKRAAGTHGVDTISGLRQLGDSALRTCLGGFCIWALNFITARTFWWGPGFYR